MTHSYRCITPTHVSLLVSDLLALDATAFEPSLLPWTERLYASLIESMKEHAQLRGNHQARLGLWSNAYATALEENLRWQASIVQGLCQTMKPEALEGLMRHWKVKYSIASSQRVCLP